MNEERSVSRARSLRYGACTMRMSPRSREARQTAESVRMAAVAHDANIKRIWTSSVWPPAMQN